MQKYAVIHKGETGFEEVHKTIKGNIDLGIEPTSFELVHHRPDMSGAVEVDEDIKKLEQVYLKAENEQGESVRVIDSPRVEIDRVLQLTSLREWVKSHSRYRSHLIVTGLSLTWGTLSTTLLLQ